MKRLSLVDYVPRLLMVLALVAGAGRCFAAAAFDPAPWIDDLAQVRSAFTAKYANLEWAVFEREADLPRLFDDTKAKLEHATNEAEARAAFDRLARKLGDGHVVFAWPKPSAASQPPDQPANPCEDYSPISRGPLLAANAAGYRPLSTPQSDEFPAGFISSGGQEVGVIKIGVFMPQGYPALCQAALKALPIPADKPCDDACGDRIATWVSARLTRDLAAQLRQLAAGGAQVLVVDIAGNGGGTEWAEAVARMVTPRRLASERVQFIHGDHWAKAFGDDENALRQWARTATTADRSMLLDLASQVETKRQEALTPCDGEPLWRGEHPACHRLDDGFYGSGLLAAADPARLHGKPWASLLFNPAEFPYEEGVWTGPLVVLVDKDVGSAASQFAAILQDNRAALIMGEPTGGGCGHTNGGTPTTLTHSRAILEVPDCVRRRADGSNEIGGVQPDILVGFAAADGPRQRAARFLAKLPEAAQRASTMTRSGP